MKQIKIRIFSDGHVQAETNGIKGKACAEYIGTLERLLESRTVESTYTDEYYQTETLEVSDTIKQHTNK